MDFWASLEHKMYYKYEGNAPDYFERELQECASIISRLDTKMMSLNEAMKKIDGDGNSDHPIRAFESDNLIKK